MMQEQWHEDQPIYKQLRDRMVDMILKGVFPEGDAVPSVRTVSADYQINHLTVSKAYQALVDEGLLLKKRGLGMFVVAGAREMILQSEREQFMTIELPRFLTRINQLGIQPEELLKHIKKGHSEGKSDE